MKKIKPGLLILVLAAVIMAYKNKPYHPATLHRYAYLGESTDGSVYYVSKDLTNAGWEKGVDYDCTYPLSTCTFLADPIYMHTDLSGNWFYYSNIPVSGIDNSGYFINLDEP